MPNPLSVDERLESQFSSWDIAPADKVPELLFALRTHGTVITIFRDHVQQTITAKITQLTAKTIRLTPQNSPLGDIQFHSSWKTLCVSYARDYALCFLTHAVVAETNAIELSYPMTVRIRKGRIHERFPLKVPMTARWEIDTKVTVLGDVMDIGLGGFLGGMNVAVFNDGSCIFQRGDAGQITLTKSDGTQWQGLAELRREQPVTQEEQYPDELIGPIIGFSLLGFAFQFKDPQESLALEQFLDGTLETGLGTPRV